MVSHTSCHLSDFKPLRKYLVFDFSTIHIPSSFPFGCNMIHKQFFCLSICQFPKSHHTPLLDSLFLPSDNPAIWAPSKHTWRLSLMHRPTLSILGNHARVWLLNAPTHNVDLGLAKSGPLCFRRTWFVIPCTRNLYPKVYFQFEGMPFNTLASLP
jgi:hypothetical protein